MIHSLLKRAFMAGAFAMAFVEDYGIDNPSEALWTEAMKGGMYEPGGNFDESFDVWFNADAKFIGDTTGGGGGDTGSVEAGDSSLKRNYSSRDPVPCPGCISGECAERAERSKE
jgi:hypothetical protein